MHPSEIDILITGEESQAICLAFRALGFNAFSCDLKPCSGGHPEWHLQMDMYDAISLRRWDFVFMHPVCTYMAVSGLFRNLKDPARAMKTENALWDVCRLLNHCRLNGIERFGFENPVSCISTRIYFDKYGKYMVNSKMPEYNIGLPKPFKATQTVQPYEFGEDASKRTCLWLIGMPKIIKTKRISGRMIDGKERWANQTDTGQNKLAPSPNRAELRSKTYPGIAKAMAEQWGKFLAENL